MGSKKKGGRLKEPGRRCRNSITFYVDDKTYEQLTEIVYDLGITLSAVMRAATRQYLDGA